MNLQFIKLLHRELIPEYSYYGYISNTIEKHIWGNYNVRRVIGTPYIISFASFNIKNKVNLTNYESLIQLLNEKMKTPSGFIKLFTFYNSLFSLPIFNVKSYRDKSLTELGLKIINKKPFFKDRHLQILFDFSKSDMAKIGIYEGNIHKANFKLANDLNFEVLFEKFRFMNMTFTNIKKGSKADNVKKIIIRHIKEFIARYKYTTLLSVGTERQHGLVDKVSIAYFKYDEFFPTFSNNNITCLLIQFDSTSYDRLDYYLRRGYVQNYIIGGSNRSDDLLEIDGEQNNPYPDLSVSNIIGPIETMFNKYLYCE